MEITAARFKAQCLRLMDEINTSREAIVITKRGRPVARLVPVDVVRTQPLFGSMSGTVAFEGDLIAPVDVAWEASTVAAPPVAPERTRRRRSRRNG